MHDEHMQTTLEGVYVAGDITGVEEASTAMEEGRIAGISAAVSLGHGLDAETKTRLEAANERITALRAGSFGEVRRKAKEQQIAAFYELKNKCGKQAEEKELKI